MECFDSFIRKDGYELQVKCYDGVTGGIFITYNIGDNVPNYKMGYDFEVLDEYGDNYNIFPYRLEEDVIVIRDGKFKKTVKYYNLEDEDCEGVLCISKYGDKLAVDIPIDYIDLYRNQYTVNKK